MSLTSNNYCYALMTIYGLDPNDTVKYEPFFLEAKECGFCFADRTDHSRIWIKFDGEELPTE